MTETFHTAQKYNRFDSGTEFDLSDFRLFSKRTLVQDDVFIAGNYIYLETRVLFDGVFEYLSQENLEIVAKLRANNDEKRNIYLGTNYSEIENILKSTDRVFSNNEYYPNDDSKEEYYYPEKTKQYYIQTLNVYYNNYNIPVTGIKFTFIRSYPHPPKLIQLENCSRIFSESVTLKWDKNLYTDSFDLYLHRDKEKVVNLNPNALIRSNLKTEEYSLNDLDNGASYYWLVLAKQNNSQHQTKSEVYSFLVDSNTNNKLENSKIIEISSLEKLREISSKPGYWDKSFILTRDIDASTTIDWNDGAGFTPIGNDSLAFTGAFNGNNHKITNIHINRPKKSNVGFFGYLDSVLVKDLWIESATIRGLNNIGILAGVSDNSSQIINCHTSGEILCDYIYGNNLAIYDEFKKNPQKEILYTMNSGGLVGINKNSSIIKLSSSSAMVEGNKVVGGLVGENSGGSKIIDSFASGDIFGYHTVGGLVAQNVRHVTEEYIGSKRKDQDTLKTELVKCYSMGTVKGELDYVSDAYLVCGGYDKHFGGFSDNTSIIGGLVGLNDSYIKNSYTTSNVNGDSGIGILVGLSLLKFSYNVDGLSQDNLDYSKIINSFYNYDKSLLNGEKVKSQLGLSDALFSEWKKQYLSQSLKNIDLSNSILIKTPEDLQNVIFTMHNPKAKYELKADLDLTEYANLYIPFLYGTFNGNGHTIKNLSIDNQDSKFLGLFGEIIGGRVNDLILENAKITGFNNVGILAGKITNKSTIGNITVRGDIIDGAIIGGLAATVDNSHITNCSCEIKILKEGKKDNKEHFSYILFSDRSKSIEIGGLIGNCNKTIISNCQTEIMYMYNIDSATNAGFIGKASDSKITESHSTAMIKNGGKSAGFIASIVVTDIENCYSKSLITSQDKHAGFVYDVNYSNITNSFSVCYVYKERRLSRFIEENRHTNITNCYYEIDDCLELKKANNEIYYADLKKKETYTDTGWDFDNVWEINRADNQGYPTLKHTKIRFMKSFYEPELKKIKTNSEEREITSLNESIKTALQEFRMDLSPEKVSKINQVNEINRKELKKIKDKDKNNDKCQWIDLDKSRKEKVYAPRQNRISNEKNRNEDNKENYIEENNNLVTSAGNNHLDMNTKRKLLMFTSGGLISVILIFLALKLFL